MRSAAPTDITGSLFRTTTQYLWASGPLGVGRRTVLVGVAWGALIVAFAVAAPAACASNEPVGRVSFVSSSNVGPGHLYWRYDATDLSTTTATVSVTFSYLGEMTIVGWSNRGAWTPPTQLSQRSSRPPLAPMQGRICCLCWARSVLPFRRRRSRRSPREIEATAL